MQAAGARRVHRLPTGRGETAARPPLAAPGTCAPIAPGRGSAAPPPRSPALGSAGLPAGSTVENKSGLLIYCSGGRPEGGRCERKSKPIFFPETAVLPGIPPSHPGDNPPSSQRRTKAAVPPASALLRAEQQARRSGGGGTKRRDRLLTGERGSPSLEGGRVTEPASAVFTLPLL